MAQDKVFAEHLQPAFYVIEGRHVLAVADDPLLNCALYVQHIIILIPFHVDNLADPAVQRAGLKLEEASGDVFLDVVGNIIGNDAVGNPLSQIFEFEGLAGSLGRDS